MPRKSTYTEAFREQALEKVYSRGERSVNDVAAQLHISHWTLKGWMKSRQRKSASGRTHAGNKLSSSAKPEASERLQLLLDSHGLQGEALSAFCRERGLYIEQLQQWREAFEGAAVEPAATREELRQLKQSNAALQRELKRKEKALSEAAALLVLQKKFQSLWEDEDA